jgi:hypothetical protein
MEIAFPKPLRYGRRSTGRPEPPQGKNGRKRRCGGGNRRRRSARVPSALCSHAYLEEVPRGSTTTRLKSRCCGSMIARVCRGNRRSVAHPPITGPWRLSGPGSQTLSVRGARLRRWHLELRGAPSLLCEAAGVVLTRYMGQQAHC